VFDKCTYTRIIIFARRARTFAVLYDTFDRELREKHVIFVYTGYVRVTLYFHVVLFRRVVSSAVCPARVSAIVIIMTTNSNEFRLCFSIASELRPRPRQNRTIRRYVKYFVVSTSINNDLHRIKRLYGWLGMILAIFTNRNIIFIPIGCCFSNYENKMKWLAAIYVYICIERTIYVRLCHKYSNSIRYWSELLFFNWNTSRYFEIYFVQLCLKIMMICINLFFPI